MPSANVSPRDLEKIRRLLCALQDKIRATLIAARDQDAAKFSQVVAVTAADTIYRVDRIGEHAILAWFDECWPRPWPVEIVMEGIEDGAHVTFPTGTPVEATRFKCIIDPIDGTRNLMYDKRSAWILAAVAPQRGLRTDLTDLVVAAMSELPTTKHGWSDQISAIRGGGREKLRAERINLLTGARSRFQPRPSRAGDCRNGFASLARFFPDGKALTAKIEEELWAELYGSDATGASMVFDDQYITTGGQLYELLVGHDRMIGDLRPLVFARLKLKSSLVCHPYDICTALILTEAGGLVEAPGGGPVRVPLDTTSPVAWVGYANAKLARAIRPVLRRLIRRHLG